MDDKHLMEDLLLTEKGVCALYLHSTIESATPQIHTAFDQTLTDSLQMQSDVYAKMSQRGWYPAQAAEAQKIQQAAQKFSAMQ